VLTWEPIRLFWTVWHFHGLRGESVITVRRAEPRDLITQHDFQRVLGQVWACEPKEALEAVTRQHGPEESSHGRPPARTLAEVRA